MSEATEADKARLQYARDVAEHEKLLLETQQLRRANSWPARATETLKSAVVVVGGIITLGIGYNLTDLKNEKLKQEVRENAAGVERLKAEQRALERKNNDYKEAISSTTRKVRQVTDLTELARRRLDSLQQLAAGPAGGQEVLAAVRTELGQLRQSFAGIDQNAGDANVELQAAKPALPQVAAAGVAPLAAQVAGLFAPTASRRGAAYQALMSYYSADPNLVPALLKQATGDPTNLNGLYNALVVAGHLSPLPPGTDVPALRQFALANRGKGPRIAERVDKLLARLPPR